jgi:ribosomal protein S6--L-glutamate ligase
VQKYISEASGGDVRAFVADGEVVVALKRIPVEGSVISNFHAGATPEKYPITPQESEVCVAATKACGLNVAGVDFVPTKNGPVVLEVNVTPGLRYLHEYGGRDPVEAYVGAIIKDFKSLDAPRIV